MHFRRFIAVWVAQHILNFSSVLRPFIPPASFALAGSGLSAPLLASLAKTGFFETFSECIQCSIAFLHSCSLTYILAWQLCSQALAFGTAGGSPVLALLICGVRSLGLSPVVRLTDLCFCQPFLQCRSFDLDWGIFLAWPLPLPVVQGLLPHALIPTCSVFRSAALASKCLSSGLRLPLRDGRGPFPPLVCFVALLCCSSAQVPILLFMHTDSSEEETRIADLTACRWYLPSSPELEQVASPDEAVPWVAADPPARYIEVNVCIGDRSICYFDVSSLHSIQDLLDASEDPGCASSTTCYRVTRITVRTAAITLGCAERPPDYITPPSSDSEA